MSSIMEYWNNTMRDSEDYLNSVQGGQSRWTPMLTEEGVGEVPEAEVEAEVEVEVEVELELEVEVELEAEVEEEEEEEQVSFQVWGLGPPTQNMFSHSQPPQLQPQESSNSEDQYSHDIFAWPPYSPTPAILQGQPSWNPPPQIPDLEPNDIYDLRYDFIVPDIRATIFDKLSSHWGILQHSVDPDAWALARKGIKQVSEDVNFLVTRCDEIRRENSRAEAEQPYAPPLGDAFTPSEPLTFAAEMTPLFQQEGLPQQQQFQLPAQQPPLDMAPQMPFPAEVQQVEASPPRARRLRELRPRPPYVAPSITSPQHQPAPQEAAINISPEVREYIHGCAAQISDVIHDIGQPYTNEVKAGPQRQLALAWLQDSMNYMSADCKRYLLEVMVPRLVQARWQGVDPMVAVQGI